jgi:hypothetical protein
MRGRANTSLKRHRLVASLISVGAHVVVIGALYGLYVTPKQVPHPQSSMLVSWINLPEPNPPGMPSTAEESGNSIVIPPAPEIQLVLTLPVREAFDTPAPDNSDILSEVQLASIANAGEQGLGKFGCDTAGLVQQALRRDKLVRKAVEDAGRLGKAVMLWNGDWVQTGGQEGKGLSAVREAVMWEVAFAPENCRNQRMHGAVLLSLADGDTRFAIGSNDWRWSDLLGVRETTRKR